MTRPARLARIVAEAEGVWLRSMMTLIVTQVGMATSKNRRFPVFIVEAG
jgi:hypothetical protein